MLTVGVHDCAEVRYDPAKPDPEVYPYGIPATVLSNPAWDVIKGSAKPGTVGILPINTVFRATKPSWCR